jgi:hypothetical protein
LSNAYDETYNYGQSGAGNEYIYHSIIDADTDLQLNENDTVVIAWSGYSRFDQFSNHDGTTWWKTLGDWSHNPDFQSLEKFVNDDGWARKSVNYITATARYLESKNIKYVFTSLYDLRVRYTESGITSHTDTYIVKLLDNIFNNGTFIYPRGLTTQMMKMRAETCSLQAGSHPNLREHQLIALAIATKLGVTINIHSDLEQYDALIYVTDSREIGKIPHLMHERNLVHILTKPGTECIPASTEKYYRNTMDEYKKLVAELFIK